MAKKELNFELNILPILDILSVLICFLLLTAVWVQMGTLDTKQAIGDNTATASSNPPSVWVSIQENGNVQLSLRDLPHQKKSVETQILKKNSQINWDQLVAQLNQFKTQWPDLKTGIIQPSAGTSYQDVIKIMDQLKQLKFEGVGLSPLGT